jgi:uncharacterized membrane protein HdeD (DUF308 family)
MKRFDIVKEMRITHACVSLLLILSGVFLLAWPEVARPIVRYLIGGNFVVLGIVRILGYYANDLYRLAFQYDLALGSFSVIFGVLLAISPDKIQTAIPYIIGVYVLMDALLKLQTAFEAKAFGMKHWWGLMLSSLVLSLCSVALLVLNTQLEAPWLLPIVLILDGGESIWNTLGTVRVRTKKEGRFEELIHTESKGE